MDPTASHYFRHIILVDDNAIDCFITKAYLEEAGFGKPLQVFTDSSLALEFLGNHLKEETAIDDWLIFLDLHMPNPNGVEFLHALQKINPSAVKRVGILSSEFVEVQIKAVREFSVFGFMDKPFSLEKLNELISHNSSSKRKS